MKNTLGWGGFGSTSREDHVSMVPGSTWEHELRPSKDPAPVSPLESVMSQVNHLSSSPVMKMFWTEIKRLLQGRKEQGRYPRIEKTK